MSEGGSVAGSAFTIESGSTLKMSNPDPLLQIFDHIFLLMRLRNTDCQRLIQHFLEQAKKNRSINQRINQMCVYTSVSLIFFCCPVFHQHLIMRASVADPLSTEKANLNPDPISKNVWIFFLTTIKM